MNSKYFVIASLFISSTTYTMDKPSLKLKPQEYPARTLNALVKFNGKKEKLAELIKHPDFGETPIFEYRKDLRLKGFVKNLSLEGQNNWNNSKAIGCNYITDLEIFRYGNNDIKLGAFLFFTFEKLDLYHDRKDILKSYYKQNPHFRQNTETLQLINIKINTPKKKSKKTPLLSKKYTSNTTEEETPKSYQKI